MRGQSLSDFPLELEKNSLSEYLIEVENMISYSHECEYLPQMMCFYLHLYFLCIYMSFCTYVLFKLENLHVLDSTHYPAAIETNVTFVIIFHKFLQKGDQEKITLI